MRNRDLLTRRRPRGWVELELGGFTFANVEQEGRAFDGVADGPIRILVS